MLCVNSNRAPLLDVIRQQIEAARSTALPGGVLAKACNYTLTLWDKLTRFYIPNCS